MYLANWNGKIVPGNEILIYPNNRSFRYGDGFFQTIKVFRRKILLKELHFQRIFHSLERLFFSIPSSFNVENLEKMILQVADKNNHSELARIRFTVYREGDDWKKVSADPSFLIQSMAASAESNQYNEKGLKVALYPDARLACDQFSSIKTNNYLRNSCASLWAKANGLDDCILYNSYDRIADATIANVFIVKDGIIKTPSLDEGCINGTMRQYLLACIRKEGMPVYETSIAPSELLQAAEIFFTNAIIGIKCIEQCGESHYVNSMSSYLFDKFISPLYK